MPLIIRVLAPRCCDSMERLSGRLTGVIRRLIVHASVRHNATLSSSSRLVSAPISAERKRVDAAMARAAQSIRRAGQISDQECESLNDIFIECTHDSELDACCSTEALASLLQHLLQLSARSPHSGRRASVLDLSEAVRFMMKRHLVERNPEAAVRLWHQISCGECGERFVSESELLTLAVQALNVHGLAAESELLFRVSRAMLTGNPLEAEAALRSGSPDAVAHVRKAYQSHNIPAATAETFNTIMNGYLQASRMEEAQKILSDMASLSLPVSEKTFEPFISWHCANKNLPSALSLFNQMCYNIVIEPSDTLWAKLVTAALQTEPRHGGGVHFAAALLMRAELIANSGLRAIQPSSLPATQPTSLRLNFIELQQATRCLDTTEKSTESSVLVSDDLRQWWSRMERLDMNSSGLISKLEQFRSPDSQHSRLSRFPLQAFLVLVKHVAESSVKMAQCSGPIFRSNPSDSHHFLVRAFQMLLYICRTSSSAKSPYFTIRHRTAFMRHCFISQSYRAALLTALTITEPDVTARTTLLQGLLGKQTLFSPSYRQAARVVAEDLQFDGVPVTLAISAVLSPLILEGDGKRSGAEIAALLKRMQSEQESGGRFAFLLNSKSARDRELNAVNVFGLMHRFKSVAKVSGTETLNAKLRLDNIFRPCAKWFAEALPGAEAMWLQKRSDFAVQPATPITEPALSTSNQSAMLESLYESSEQAPASNSMQSNSLRQLSEQMCKKLQSNSAISISSLLSEVRSVLQQYEASRLNSVANADSSIVVLGDLCLALIQRRCFSAAWSMMHDAHQIEHRLMLNHQSMPVAIRPKTHAGGLSQMYQALSAAIMQHIPATAQASRCSDADLEHWQQCVDEICASASVQPISIRQEDKLDAHAFDLTRLLGQSLTSSDAAPRTQWKAIFEAASLSSWNGTDKSISPTVPISSKVADFAPSKQIEAAVQSPSSSLPWYSIEPAFEHPALSSTVPAHCMLADLLKWSAAQHVLSHSMLQDYVRLYSRCHFSVCWAIWSCWTSALPHRNSRRMLALRRRDFIVMLDACRHAPHHSRHAHAVWQLYSQFEFDVAIEQELSDEDQYQLRRLGQWAMTFHEFDSLVARHQVPL